MLSDLEIYFEHLSRYLIETQKCRSVVVCDACDLWQEKTHTRAYLRVFTGRLVMDCMLLMEHTVGDGQMFPETILVCPQCG